MSKPLDHKSDVNKLFVKCQPKHEVMLGKSFNYKKAFCYQWKESVEGDKKVKEVWRVKVYDIEEYHELFVHMGVIGKINAAF